MTKYVRVKDKANGNEFTVTEAASHVKRERFDVIDEPAVDRSGRPRPPKYPATKTPPASGGGQATKAATTEAKKEAKES